MGKGNFEGGGGNGESGDDKPRIIDLRTGKPIPHDEALERQAGVPSEIRDPAATVPPRQSIETPASEIETAKMAEGFKKFAYLVNLLLGTEPLDRLSIAAVGRIKTRFHVQSLSELFDTLGSTENQREKDHIWYHAITQEIIDAIAEEQDAGHAIEIPEEARAAIIRYRTASGV